MPAACRAAAPAPHRLACTDARAAAALQPHPQAATAASMADSFNDTPAEGDGFTYEHHASREVGTRALCVYHAHIRALGGV